VVWIPATLGTSEVLSAQTLLETDSAIARFRHDLWPRLQRPFILSAALVAVCCLGEVSASKLPATPGGESFAHDAFTRMHYGITPELAVMCVVLLGQIGLTAGLGFVVMRVLRPRPRPARSAPPLP
jgi:ABC-type spermidine/putrescine transport system permease subunit II